MATPTAVGPCRLDPVDTVSFARSTNGWRLAMVTHTGRADARRYLVYPRIKLNDSPAFAKEPATNGVGYLTWIGPDGVGGLTGQRFP